MLKYRDNALFRDRLLLCSNAFYKRFGYGERVYLANVEHRKVVGGVAGYAIAAHCLQIKIDN